MATLRRLGPDDWEVFREIRLASLTDSPDAFGSTLAREQGFGEDDWRQRLSGPVYVVEDSTPVSVGGIFDNDGTPHVWGMWTAPEHRGRGHARRILDALIPPGTSAQLDVNVTNRGARTAYERYGFVATGRVEPLRPGSEMMIELMVLRPLAVGPGESTPAATRMPTSPPPRPSSSSPAASGTPPRPSHLTPSAPPAQVRRRDQLQGE